MGPTDVISPALQQEVKKFRASAEIPCAAPARLAVAGQVNLATGKHTLDAVEIEDGDERTDILPLLRRWFPPLPAPNYATKRGT